MTIGKKIRSLRHMRGMTQEDLAKASNTSKQNIYKYESGIITNIPTERVQLLAVALGVDPNYLMGWETNPNQTNELEKIEIAFFDGYKELNEENKAILRDMVNIMRERQRR